MASIAWGFPSEIIDSIVQGFAARRTHQDNDSLKELPFRSTNNSWMSRRDLGSCSMVCRYWALRCRPFQLSSLIVRSRKDLDELLEHFNTSGPVVPPMAQCVRHLTLQLHPTWVYPWFHPIIYTYFRNDHSTLNVEIVDSYSGCISPRQLPPTDVPVQVIRISNTRFRTPKPFIQLLRDFRNYWSLECANVDFNESGTTRNQYEQRFTARLTPSKLAISFQDCIYTDAVVKHLLESVSTRLLRHTRNVEVCRDLLSVLSSLFLRQDATLSQPTSGVYYTYSTPDPDDSLFETLLSFRDIMFHVCFRQGKIDPIFAISSRHGSWPRIESINWNLLEEQLLRIPTQSFMTLRTEDKDFFKWLLDVVPKGTHFNRLCNRQGRLRIFFIAEAPMTQIEGGPVPTPEWLPMSLYVNMSRRTRYRVAGRIITLTPRQTFDLKHAPEANVADFWKHIVDVLSESAEASTELSEGDSDDKLVVVEDSGYGGGSGTGVSHTGVEKVGDGKRAQESAVENVGSD